MRLIVFLLAALWYETSSYQAEAAVGGRDHHQRTNRRASARSASPRSRVFFNRVWKRQDDLGYLEQCSILQFWDKQIGRVNVLAFLDSSWQFSHRQATMLKVLRERFERTGFLNIQFFAVNAGPGEARFIERAEVEAEEETWRQISPSEAEGVPPVSPTPEALVEALGPHIYFIQDNEELQIWPKLRAFRDQILVIDRCGRLTYQVIVPWSILHFPYVKAAILSTYKDEPCGHCEFQESPFDTTTTTTTTERNKPLTSSAESSTSPYTLARSEHTDSSLPIGDDSSAQTEDYHSQITTEESSTMTADISAEDSSTLATNIGIETTDNFVTDTPPPNSTEEEESSTTLDIEIGDATTSTLIYQTDDNDDVSGFSTETTTKTMSDTESSLDTSTPAYQDSTMMFQDDVDNYTSYSTDDYHSDGNFSRTTAMDLEVESQDFETTTTTETTTEDAIGTEDETTDRLNSQTEIPMTTEMPMTTMKISNASLATNESRLREAEDDGIESLDARDVLKSRSTNARSVSPNDGTENHLEDVETNSSEPSKIASSSAALNKTDYLLPIRIIMRAPHVDEYSDRTMKAHEYLVLKTGEPDYHDHLDSGEPAGLMNDGVHLDNDDDDDDDDDDEAKSKLHVRKKSGALSRTFGKDESPGLYGEVADYWRNFGNEQLIESTQTSSSNDEDEEELEDAEDVDEEQILEHVEDELVATPTSAMHSINTAKGKVGNEPAVVGSVEEIELDSDKPYDNNADDANEEVDVVDEEAKSKLIAHYSKLLPWLYYVLAK